MSIEHHLTPLRETIFIIDFSNPQYFHNISGFYWLIGEVFLVMNSHVFNFAQPSLRDYRSHADLTLGWIWILQRCHCPHEVIKHQIPRPVLGKSTSQSFGPTILKTEINFDKGTRMNEWRTYNLGLGWLKSTIKSKVMKTQNVTFIFYRLESTDGSNTKYQRLSNGYNILTFTLVQRWIYISKETISLIKILILLQVGDLGIVDEKLACFQLDQSKFG